MYLARPLIASISVDSIIVSSMSITSVDRNQLKYLHLIPSLISEKYF